ncbi:TetR/AcrR family transcriptional regulator [Clostridium beijerinckii]|uniref:AcrR family transcriptional regulator n=2 Tax=Clostridium beijerinckii TaxID=1520 RepID=A0AAX0BAC1_CLOBE|nr:TetR/AcrR family transcriptional regulator [Clostridium beijerinckii]MBA8933507.1 AcrR family transcriptional regulator [Clostridium beijerinckii]NOW05542.1 AcrR family transcriptional regulator [Clostridium beijerinckii]NRT44019.1 AcrR family transcriptional regulator [Clostridium beijerinckii]NRT91926.1 AcrR family transcriptional regulator [Clostridium beijerinckii]NRU37706.1 AcrR family transcriptional regulator [Clostridium beijerinckii]
MPKIVDHENQKEIIAGAAWKVIQNNGIENATVRKIAQESGLSPGALRHYFNSQDQLLEFAMKLVVEHVEQRFLNINVQTDSITLACAKEILLNLIPIDEERMLEMEVWLSLSIKALNESSLKKISDDTYDLIFKAIFNVLRQLNEAHLLKPNLDLELEAQRLHILIDGLSLQRIISPHKITIEQVNIILEEYISELSNVHSNNIS